MPEEVVNASDAAREIDKCVQALTAVERYLGSMNEMNAALHLAKDVLPSPLTAVVRTAIDGANRARERFDTGEGLG